MTYEEACRLLGYPEPPGLDEFSQEIVVETVVELSENGTKTINPATRRRIREEIEEFG